MANTRRIQLVPGTWFAGYHVPFFVSHGMIQPSLAKWGLTQISWHERRDALPAGVIPKDDPRYRDSWESWVSAVYSGIEKDVEIPYYDHVDWLLHKPTSATPETPSPLTKAPASDATEISDGAVLLAVCLLWVLSRGR